MRIVLSTVPVEAAKRLALTLVDARVAACVNVVPGVTSVYRWQGQVEESEEALLVIKTDDAALDQLFDRLVYEHPYDVPEIVAVDVTRVHPAYAAWVHDETSSGEAD